MTKMVPHSKKQQPGQDLQQRVIRYMGDRAFNSLELLSPCGRCVGKQSSRGARTYIEAHLRYSQEYLDKSHLDTSDVDAFVELHIEQGPLLENEKKEVGIVTGIFGPSLVHVQFNGSGGHGGGMPMEFRSPPGLPPWICCVRDFMQSCPLRSFCRLTTALRCLQTGPGAFRNDPSLAAAEVALLADKAARSTGEPSTMTVACLDRLPTSRTLCPQAELSEPWQALR